MREAAQQLGILLVGPPIEGPIREPEYRRVFQEMTQKNVGALIVSDQVEHYAQRRLITGLAESSRLPALYPWRGYAQIGGLMAYGINNIDMFLRAADYIDKILKGAKPGEIPIYQPTKFELVINLKTAKVLGVEITTNTARPRRRGDRMIRQREFMSHR